MLKLDRRRLLPLEIARPNKKEMMASRTMIGVVTISLDGSVSSALSQSSATSTWMIPTIVFRSTSLLLERFGREHGICKLLTVPFILSKTLVLGYLSSQFVILENSFAMSLYFYPATARWFCGLARAVTAGLIPSHFPCCFTVKAAASNMHTTNSMLADVTYIRLLHCSRSLYFWYPRHKYRLYLTRSILHSRSQSNYHAIHLC